MESGYFIAIANSCSIIEYASEDNVIMKGMPPVEEHQMRPAQEDKDRNPGDRGQAQSLAQCQDVPMEGYTRELP